VKLNAELYSYIEVQKLFEFATDGLGKMSLGKKLKKILGKMSLGKKFLGKMLLGKVLLGEPKRSHVNNLPL
jgi:hypothetical protein